MVNQFLNFDTADCHITGGCDLFTTKPVQSDRKLYKTVDKQFDAILESTESKYTPNEIFVRTKRRFSSSEAYNHLSSSAGAVENSSPRSLDNTPFGPLSDTTSRKVFAHLIGILNATYPDNDFTSLEPMDFAKITLNSLRSKFDNTLISLGKNDELEWIWDIVNSQMDLNDCVIFELSTEDDEKFFLNDEPGQLWTMKWFIFNKKRKRVAFLYLDGFRLNNSPSLRPVGNNRRNLTIEDGMDNEEYDLTYSDDEVMFDDDIMEDEEDTNSAVTPGSKFELAT